MRWLAIVLLIAGCSRGPDETALRAQVQAAIGQVQQQMSRISETLAQAATSAGITLNSSASAERVRASGRRAAIGRQGADNQMVNLADRNAGDGTRPSGIVDP